MGVNLKQNADGSMGLQGYDKTDGEMIPVMLQYDPGSDADQTGITMSRRMIVKSIIGRPDTLDGASTTLSVKKAPSGTALASGTALHSGTMNLNANAATTQSLTLSTTSSDLIVEAGDSIGLDFSGALTNGVGCVTVWLAPA